MFANGPGGANTLIDEEILMVNCAIRSLGHVQQSPVFAMLLDPPGKLAMPDMRCCARYLSVTRINDHEPRSGCKQIRHVGLEDRILDQMKDDVERDRQVGTEKPGSVSEAGTVVVEEAFGRVVVEASLAQFNADRETSRPI